MAIKRTKSVEDRLVDVRVDGPGVAIATHKVVDGEQRSVERILKLKEAKKLRKQLKHAIAAAEENANPFG